MAWLELARRCGQTVPARKGKHVWIGMTLTGINGQALPYPIVFKVTERTIDKKGQTLVFPDIDVETYWCSLPEMPAQEVIHWYHDHGTSEQYHSELKTDMAELRARGLHAAPIHISKSTDPLQPLEKEHRPTLYLRRTLRANRDRFTTITMLTKNPALLCAPEYLEVIRSLTRFQVEVTCPFYQDKSRRFYEPGAPSVESRLEGIRRLREHGIAVSLRMDPIFPRDPLPGSFRKRCLRDYGIPESQTDRDVEMLVAFAADVRCTRIITSPLKLIAGRWGRSELLETYLELYRDANGGRPIKKGTSYRLPWNLYHHWLQGPKELADSLGIELIHCKKNLVATT